MDQLRAMAAFARAADLGSFAAVAAELSVSPTMVGLYVRSIERRTGTKLINRTTRSQTLTEAGIHYAARCRELLAGIEQAETEVAAYALHPRGQLRIAAPVQFGAQSLTPELAAFAATYPDISIDLLLDDNGCDVFAGAADVAFQVGRVLDDRLISRPLEPFRMTLCAAPAYLRSAPILSDPSDLTNHQCIAHPHQASGWHLSRRGTERVVAIGGRMRTNNCEALRTAALAGCGITMVAEALVTADLARQDLVRVLPDWAAPERLMQLVYAPDLKELPKVRTFIDFAMEHFGPASPRPQLSLVATLTVEKVRTKL